MLEDSLRHSRACSRTIAGEGKYKMMFELLEDHTLEVASSFLSIADITSCRASCSRGICWLERVFMVHDASALASRIERELHMQLADKAYTGQARSILHNLKDPMNFVFRFKALVGYVEAQEMPVLSGEQMASDSRNAHRERVRKECMQEAIWEGGVKYCKFCKGRKTSHRMLSESRLQDAKEVTVAVHVTCLTCHMSWEFRMDAPPTKAWLQERPR